MVESLNVWYKHRWVWLRGGSALGGAGPPCCGLCPSRLCMGHPTTHPRPALLRPLHPATGSLASFLDPRALEALNPSTTIPPPPCRWSASFYPAFCFGLQAVMARVPWVFAEACVWTLMVYFMVGRLDGASWVEKWVTSKEEWATERGGSAHQSSSAASRRVTRLTTAPFPPTHTPTHPPTPTHTTITPPPHHPPPHPPPRPPPHRPFFRLASQRLRAC